MRFARSVIWMLWCCLLFAASGVAQTQKRAMQFDDLIAMHRLSDPQVSPDGKWVVYVVATPNMKANHSVSNIWIVPAEGGVERQLTRSGDDSRPRWSPDGKQIAFLSSRDGATQIYVMSVFGGEASRVTFLSTDADNEVWSPDGKWLAFTSRVYPDCRDDACNKERDAVAAKNPVKAHVATRLLYRHWT
ncbi:MAG TPA: hypothetical protein VGU63_06545, partial [Candidatus Acidoferrales bacterium]|nr:hypothetical protein [Candidatus Acidoferrales bacterium]